MTSASIQFTGITKRYPGVTALAEVSFDVVAGSCHAVCGENGAGKSTLGRLLAGIAQPDAGEIRIGGQAVRFATPRDALTAGVAMVHQELAFCENLTVGDNLCLRGLPKRFGFVDRGALRERARGLLEAVGAGIDPDREISSLSIAERQLVQIAAAVGEGARVVIFDEPTSSLGQAESANLFSLIAHLRASGVTVLYVSHRLEEIFRLCDAVTVLRDGQVVATRPAAGLNEGGLVEMMIGRRLAQYYPEHLHQTRGEECLRVEGLSSPGRFHDVSFTLHAGEVVGLAGLVGAGRSAIAQAIFGLDPRATGTVSVRGARARIRSPRDAVALGIGYVPEDRKLHGLVMTMRAGENATLATLGHHARGGWILRDRERAHVESLFGRLHVRGAADTATAALSGGNQQKVVLAKWLAAGSDVMLLDEPTRGVDVGAKAELHSWIDTLAAAGAAVLLISSELPELINLSSRILVLRDGRLVADVPRESVTSATIARFMTGLHQ